VRRELRAADAVMPSLDAGTERAYRAVNRPWPGLTLGRLVAGLLAFRAEYSGQLWMEVMLVRGLNDGDQELEAMADVLRRVRPDRVSLNVPARPAAEAWVAPPDAARLARAAALLGAATDAAPPAASAGRLPPAESLEIILRHPLPEEALAAPAAGGEVRLLTRRGSRFWVPAAGRYA
jgi:wyosine [tRNA(Phe)-imidazoG37] synthetase (radical SAM superfamily)